MTDIAESPSTEPPPAPRSVTAHVSRRLWLDPRVFSWSLLAIALVVIALFIAAQGAFRYWSLKHLLSTGTPIEAKIRGTQESGTLVGKRYPPETPVTLDYTFNNQAYSVTGVLRGRKEQIVTGDPVSILIDPNAPMTWAAATETPSLLQQFLGPLLILPLVLFVVLITWWKRMSLLRVWQLGEAREATVLRRHNVALPPHTVAIECSPAAQSRDKRVSIVYASQRVAPREAGSPIWVIDGPKGKGPSIAAVALT